MTSRENDNSIYSIKLKGEEKTLWPKLYASR